eukprot:CAMPEP_0115489684 /NCGR_PEP_ID=MMETSP0271-20121206/62151_1 /TAXON_ID=71861 /ORGANISM="Scrippsiella trochoidea, Strain CCMP3099" /LENGTH=202 /DNA_ID=CAMNT_0002917879 /DNA_START=154 /DNA_END=762 /DNA_ORIENTATION=-
MSLPPLKLPSADSKLKQPENTVAHDYAPPLAGTCWDAQARLLVVAQACALKTGTKLDSQSAMPRLCLSVLQHPLGTLCQELRHSCGQALNSLALHEVLVHEVAASQDDEQVQREEGSRHRLPPQALRDRLLVEDLSYGPMRDEHWEGKSTQAGHHRGAEEPRDGGGALGQAIPVQGSQELCEEWHKQGAPDDGIIEVKTRQA